MIRGIAEQTNLLALNAAIEAAEQVSKAEVLTVVADEVRAPGFAHSESTKEIQTCYRAAATSRAFSEGNG